MADVARIDANGTKSLLAASSVGGQATVTLYANPTTHRLLVDMGNAAVATTWASSGNSNVVTDSTVTASSFISIMNSAIPHGLWSVVPTAGSFTITSSDSEDAGFAFSYKVFPN